MLSGTASRWSIVALHCCLNLDRKAPHTNKQKRPPVASGRRLALPFEPKPLACTASPSRRLRSALKRMATAASCASRRADYQIPIGLSRCFPQNFAKAARPKSATGTRHSCAVVQGDCNSFTALAARCQATLSTRRNTPFTFKAWVDVDTLLRSRKANYWV